MNPHDAGDDIDDHRPRRADHFGGRGTEIADPHHVEDDVQQAAVQPRGAQHRPPLPEPEHRNGAARAEQQQRRTARRRECYDAAAHQLDSSRPDASSVRTIENRRRADDQRRRTESAPSCRSTGANPHSPGLARPHDVALVVADADERSARRTDDRSGRSALKTWSIAFSHRLWALERTLTALLP